MQQAVSYIKSVYAEFNRVSFPSKDATIRLTAYVIGVSLATGLFVTAVDFGFKEALSRILIK